MFARDVHAGESHLVAMLMHRKLQRNTMRVNLVVPFQERDKVKALGARWDTALRVWYVVNHPDPRQLERWLPEVAAFYRKERGTSKAAGAHLPVQPSRSATKVQTVVSNCSCNVLPWEDCEHTGKS